MVDPENHPPATMPGPTPGTDAQGDSRAETTPGDSGHRLRLVGDVLTFQIKLGLDGLRDLLLMPVSIAAGIIGVLRGGPDADLPFRQVIRFGRRTEVWINLFGRHRGNTADALIEPLREQMLDQVSRGIQRRAPPRTVSPDRLADAPVATPDVDGTSQPVVPADGVTPGAAKNRTSAS